MRRHLTLVAFAVQLAGCVVQPDGAPGYGYDYGYAQLGYPAPAYAGEGESYPGYSYNDGSPYMTVEGAALPLIFFGGAWGYYDGYQQFHRAPHQVWRHLEAQHPSGYGARPFEGRPARGGFGAAPQPRPEWYQPAPSGGFAAPPPHADGFTPPPSHAGGFTAPAARAPAPVAAPAAAPRHEDRRCPASQPRC